MHLLERGQNDDFLDSHSEYEQRFLEFLYFLEGRRKEQEDGVTIVQVGDMYDLWQARGNTNLIVQAYVDVLGNVEKLKPVYIIGNHDIALYKWYKEQGQTFNREWQWLLRCNGKPRILFEHGFQADFANNMDSWSGAIGQEISRLVGYLEYLEPDIDVILGEAWDSVSRMFNIYNAGLSPTRNPGVDRFHYHGYTSHYIERMQKYNRGESSDHHGPTDLAVAVIGHTHTARLVSKPGDDGRTLYLLDCGSWVNGGHEFGLISGRELAVCQWD
jgi:UDP-2,3-diacylglucosamine pyrophosphatase LpxH